MRCLRKIALIPPLCRWLVTSKRSRTRVSSALSSRWKKNFTTGRMHLSESTPWWVLCWFQTMANATHCITETFQAFTTLTRFFWQNTTFASCDSLHLCVLRVLCSDFSRVELVSAIRQLKMFVQLALVLSHVNYRVKFCSFSKETASSATSWQSISQNTWTQTDHHLLSCMVCGKSSAQLCAENCHEHISLAAGCNLQNFPC